MQMRRNSIILLLLLLLMAIPISSCSTSDELHNNEVQTSEQTLNTSLPTPYSPPEHDLMQKNDNSAEGNVGEAKFDSFEEAYYYKYCELAEKYGTHALYDVKYGPYDYSGRNCLYGVCIVNLIDFNGDGVQDLFVIYSNGQMKKVVIDNYRLEVFDFPTNDTYEMEIWTCKDGELELLLHDSSVSAYDSSSFSYRNPNDVITLDYRISITVFENESGNPVLQKYYYNKNGDVCEYENIYFSGESIVRDSLSYREQVFLMNYSETTWDVWIENVASYDKILLSALIANSWLGTSTYLQEVYGMDYNFTLAQTERVIGYLNNGDEVPSWLSKWFIAEGEYLSLYMKELYRSNMLFCEVEESEKYFTRHHYALYDIDQNGTPELILYEGSSGAGTHFHFYSIIDGEIVYSGFYGRTSLYADNEGGLIAYYGRMNGYHIDLLSLEDGLIKATFIAGGSITGEEPYPELDEFGFENFRYLAFCPPEISLTLYTYNQSLDPFWLY